jgi:hypothetical protein
VRRISIAALRILEPTDPQDLLGSRWQGQPEPGTRAELDVAQALTEALSDRLGAAVAELHPSTVDPADLPRRWSWLKRLMR